MHGKLNMKKAKDVVFWCLFLFAFFLFARKSNLVPTNVKEIDSTKILLRKDVELINRVLIVSIKWSKTIQFGEKVLKIPLIEIPGSDLCPVTAYENMCSMVPANDTDPLFSLPHKKCIVYSQFQSKLRELLQKTGLNSELYSTHSFRRGGTTLAFQAQVPVELIKAHGDWKTDCYQKYLSFSLEDRILVVGNMRQKILSVDK